MRIGLAGGDRAVPGQRERAGEREEDAAIVLDGLPREVGAADLGDGGGDEQRDRAGGHAGIAPAVPVTRRSPRASSPIAAAAARCSAATTAASTARPVRLSSIWWETS